MLYVYATSMCLLNAVWLALVFFYLPGNWLIVLTTGALAWWQRDVQAISFWTVGVMAFLALIGEVIEFMAGMGGAKKAGAGWLASISAGGGGLGGGGGGGGLISIPFSRPLVGAGVRGRAGGGGLWWGGGDEQGDEVRSGVGAGVGVFIGTASKIAIGAVLWLMAAIAVFF